MEKSNQNVFLIQLDASSIAEFEISEFEIARVDYTYMSKSADVNIPKQLHVVNKLVMFPITCPNSLKY